MQTYDEYTMIYKKAIARAYDNGLSCKRLATLTGLSPTTVLKYVVQAGYRVRQLGRHFDPDAILKPPPPPTIRWKDLIKDLQIDEYVVIDQPLKPAHGSNANQAARKLNIKVKVRKINARSFLIQRVK